HFVLKIGRRGEVDIFLVERIPEMVMGRRDDLVEGAGAAIVTLRVHHRLEVIRRNGVISIVLCDLARFGHLFLSTIPLLASAASDALRGTALAALSPRPISVIELWVFVRCTTIQK